jgi:cytochrome c peroxidase
MPISRNVPIVTLASLVAIGFGCGTAPSSARVDAAKLAMFSALPESVPPKTGGLTEERVALGRMLYYEARLSKSQTISCNSCHELAKYGVDDTATSAGFKGQHGDRNSPTVYNAAAHFVQFWDGRAADVEAQAKGPVLNPVEMAASDKTAVAVLKSMPEYVAGFQKAFPGEKDPVTFDNMAIAIGAFERKLVTPAPWDKFLKGDQNALTAEQKVGFNTFTDTGCANCHAGMLLGGNLYQKLGASKSYPDSSDPGRYKVTNNESDRGYFKVPSLRNVAKTGPYFHNGKVPTLQQAVVQMADYQLGKQLTPQQTEAVVAYLNALTGEIPADYIKAPELPKSTARTPKELVD